MYQITILCMLLLIGQVTLAQEDSLAQNNTEDDRHFSKRDFLKMYLNRNALIF